MPRRTPLAVTMASRRGALGVVPGPLDCVSDLDIFHQRFADHFARPGVIAGGSLIERLGEIRRKPYLGDFRGGRANRRPAARAQPCGVKPALSFVSKAFDHVVGDLDAA